DAVAATGASSIKDMGQVMAQLKSTHAGQMDFSAASQKVKAALLGEG
ncbi:MAG: GatB/YqeY domain-containing protein, partial [Pseudomonadota bacterium]|nr:GatB/YqeY domain-containing protein [Pseudomonadota bacterium]